jgi:hypothetical protein
VWGGWLSRVVVVCDSGGMSFKCDPVASDVPVVGSGVLWGGDRRVLGRLVRWVPGGDVSVLAEFVGGRVLDGEVFVVAPGGLARVDVSREQVWFAPLAGDAPRPLLGVEFGSVFAVEDGEVFRANQGAVMAEVIGAAMVAAELMAEDEAGVERESVSVDEAVAALAEPEKRKPGRPKKQVAE